LLHQFGSLLLALWVLQLAHMDPQLLASSRPNERNQAMIRTFLASLDAKLDDIVKVNAITAASVIVSLGDFEQWTRVIGLVAALIYTSLKIVQTIKDIRK
jgi:hypothetical protein